MAANNQVQSECPKCGYQRGEQDRHVHPGICPQCGIAYVKWRQTRAAVSLGSEQPQYDAGNRRSEFKARIIASLFYVPERTVPTEYWGRVIALMAFTLWGASFIVGGLDWHRIGGSFLHNINLPFHEFGHVLFTPFGRFMMILGGSLFQVVMPLGLMLAFLIKRHDTFGASIMLWWSGQNFVDIAPYIADAPYRGIPLISGLGEDAHDWGNLLSMTHSLDRAAGLAWSSFVIGSALMLLAVAWGAYVLWLQRQRFEK